MHGRGDKGAEPAAFNVRAAVPSAVDATLILGNPVGFTVIIGEIAARNPIVRQALARRAVPDVGQGRPALGCHPHQQHTLRGTQIMAQDPETSQTQKPAAARSPHMEPPVDIQGGGKPFSLGAPPRYVKYNIATKILADPEARMRFSQPYSGQRRLWPG